MREEVRGDLFGWYVGWEVMRGDFPPHTYTYKNNLPINCVFLQLRTQYMHLDDTVQGIQVDGGEGSDEQVARDHARDDIDGGEDGGEGDEDGEEDGCGCGVWEGGREGWSEQGGPPSVRHGSCCLGMEAQACQG